MRSRLLIASSLLAAVVPAALTPAAGQSLTRIEPRPYYGSVITVERGVRVWRPLPPTRHMIINPTNSPVSVNINDETINYNGQPAGGTPLADGNGPYGNGNGYGNGGYGNGYGNGYYGDPYLYGRGLRGNQPHRRAGALVNPRAIVGRPVPRPGRR